jgi:hypothetical protein
MYMLMQEARANADNRKVAAEMRFVRHTERETTRQR